MFFKSLLFMVGLATSAQTAQVNVHNYTVMQTKDAFVRYIEDTTGDEVIDSYVKNGVLHVITEDSEFTGTEADVKHDINLHLKDVTTKNIYEYVSSKQ